jgi:cytochrome c peroxidase
MVSGGRPLAVSLGIAIAVAMGAGAAACESVDDPIPVSPVLAPEAGPEVDAAKPGLCIDGKPAGDWPPGPYEIGITGTLPPDLTFEGPSGTVRIKDYYEPCASRSRLLVVRSAAAWCGPCGWHATHTTKLIGDARYADRLLLLDLLIADEDNMPPTLASATRWRARIDAPAGVDAKLAMDAKYIFSAVLAANNVLPEYVIVDTRTMTVRTVLNSPDPETFAGYMAIELASLDGKPRVDLPERTLHDGLLTDDQWDLLQDMKLPGAPPPDPTNEYGDVAAAAVLGKKLFEDVGLSPSGTVSCATCHDATKGFGDALPQSMGVAKVDRNSPSVVLASHSRWQFWDGRADTLWMQALGPPENAKEMGASRVFVAREIAARYSTEYAAVFGAKYPFPDLTGVPASGKPGDAAYDALTQAKKDELTRVYVNVGKAIAAFERTLRLKPTALDRYRDGELTALQGPQKKALEQFFKVGCVQCHWGPRLTDDAFHNIRFPTGRQDGTSDRGRFDVLVGLAASEFVATSKWSDAPQSAKLLAFATAPSSMLGAFKTPSLRGVVQSAPYGHGGQFRFLSDVSQHYGQRAQQVPDTKTAGSIEAWLPNFDANVQTNIPSFLDVLTADLAP